MKLHKASLNVTSTTPLPKEIDVLGEQILLRGKKLALFCSTRCPGDLILRAYDYARKLREDGVTVIGGFHSPVEKECLRILLRERHPLIICLARGLQGMRIPSAWRKPIQENRLLLLSPFGSKVKRPTEQSAQTRNELVAALADEILFIYVAPGSKTEAFAARLKSEGRKILSANDIAPTHALAGH